MHARGVAGNDRARVGPHHQHGFDCRQNRRALYRRLFGFQTRADRFDAFECAVEVAAKGITVNAICPGYVDTDMMTRGVENITRKTGRTADEAMASILKMSPQNRLITSEEVAAFAVLLASEEGRGINGQAISVDGGTVLS